MRRWVAKNLREVLPSAVRPGGGVMYSPPVYYQVGLRWRLQLSVTKSATASAQSAQMDAGRAASAPKSEERYLRAFLECKFEPGFRYSQ